MRSYTFNQSLLQTSFKPSHQSIYNGYIQQLSLINQLGYCPASLIKLYISNQKQSLFNKLKLSAQKLSLILLQMFCRGQFRSLLTDLNIFYLMQKDPQPTVPQQQLSEQPSLIPISPPTTDKSQRAVQRKTLLVKLLRSRRQKDADDILQESIAKQQETINAFKVNKFGVFCLQAGDLERAQKLLLKGQEIIEKRFDIFTNCYMNLGNLWAQRKDYQKAIDNYQKVLQLSPHREPKDFIDHDPAIFSKHLNSFSAYVDAHTNLAVMYVQLNQFQKGFQFCKKSLQLKPEESESQVNFTDILRQLGKKDEAIEHSWKQIAQYSQKHGKPDYAAPNKIQIKPWLPEQGKQIPQQQRKISILTVKWGARYNADYVNKLYAGILRNTTWKTTFYCFTDDGNGLHPDIKIQKLQQGWKRWWGKVTLFNVDIPGRKFYIDLDMIITGNLDKLFAYDGEFTTLRTGDLACEKNHKDGYNSSVMIWSGDHLRPIYQTLKDNFESVTKFIVRFDFWLEMTIANADFVQALYPGVVIDFLADAKQNLPEGSSVVCFARKPKPQDYPAPWVKQYWVL